MSCAHCGSRVPSDALKCPACGSTTFADGALPAKPVRSSAAGGIVVLVLIVGVAAVLVPVGLLVLGGGLGAAFFRSGSVDDGAMEVSVKSGSGGFDGLRANGRFVVAADPAAPPFLSGSEGAWEGFEYALGAALADAAGVPLEIRPTPYDELLAQVASGTVDAAIGQLPPDPAPNVAYTRSYLQYNLCLTVRPEITSVDRVKTGTIGMYDDRTAEQAAKAVLGTGWTRRVYRDYGYFRDLAEGRLDAVVYDCPLTRYELAKSGADLRILDARMGVATYSIAVPASRPELKADLDRVLGELGGNGLLQQLASRWLGETPAEDAPAAKIVVVRGGESLDAVAARTLGSAARSAELLEWNRDILGSDPNAVYAGMQLRVR